MYDDEPESVCVRGDPSELFPLQANLTIHNYMQIASNIYHFSSMEIYGCGKKKGNV